MSTEYAIVEAGTVPDLQSAINDKARRGYRLPNAGIRYYPNDKGKQGVMLTVIMEREVNPNPAKTEEEPVEAVNPLVPDLTPAVEPEEEPVKPTPTFSGDESELLKAQDHFTEWAAAMKIPFPINKQEGDAKPTNRCEAWYSSLLGYPITIPQLTARHWYQMAKDFPPTSEPPKTATVAPGLIPPLSSSSPNQ